jgi:hypothetical protein
MQNPSENISLDDLHSVESFAQKYPALLTVQTLRWQLRHRDRNGMAQCCVALGKKLLISKSRYESWLAGQAGKGRAAG